MTFKLIPALLTSVLLASTPSLSFAQAAPAPAAAGQNEAGQAVLDAFDRSVRLVPDAPKAAYTCKDADDQKFIDLAAEHRATLVSKDDAVLCMARRLARVGVHVCREWRPTHAP